MKWISRANSVAPDCRVSSPIAHLPPLIWSLLQARGIVEPAAIKRWLAPALKELKDPFVLKDMERAVSRLAVARERQETVCIYADYDLDGTSACALLKTGLELLGFKNVVYYQPSRLKEGYGLHEAAIRALVSERGVSLFVTVDLGITAIREAEVARELGVDLIITDHHLPKESLPLAFAVVNPNRGDCSSGLGHLCGTGVAFYLVLALKRSLLESGALKESFDPKTLLDCFVIGTLTDMVPLTDENRVLVKHGLIALAQTKRPGLRALLQALGMWNQPLTGQDVAIRFAPKLNALSRLELGVRPLDLYLTEDPVDAERLVAEVLSCNQSRVALQRSAEAEAMEMLRDAPPEKCIVIASRGFHRGVVGLVATRISQSFGLPSFVGAEDDHGVVVGSARGPDGCDLLAAMEAAGDALKHFGGHAQAAGFELEAARMPRLIERLADHFRAAKDSEEPNRFYDAECSLAELSETFMDWYDRLAPFGAQFAPGLFRLQGISVHQARPLKGGHLRLTLVASAQAAQDEAFTGRDRASEAVARLGLGQEKKSIAAIWFSPPSGSPGPEQLLAAPAIEALVEPQWNWFRGVRSLQLLVHDLKVLPTAQDVAPIANMDFTAWQSAQS